MDASMPINRIVKLIKRRVSRPAPAFAPRFILFDFDGTLADTMYVGGESFNKFADQFGYRKATIEDLAALREMTLPQVLKHMRIPVTKLPRIAKCVTGELNKRMGEVEIFPGLREVLVELHGRGFTLGLLTSNSEANVQAFLEKYDLPVFTHVHCGSKLMGKARIIRSMLRRAGFKKHETILIGDETRDIEASKKAGVRCAAVAWGYNSPEALRRTAPDYFLETSADIARLLDNFRF